MATGVEVVVQSRRSNAGLDILKELVSKIPNDDRQNFSTRIQIQGTLFLFFLRIQLGLLPGSLLLSLLSLFGTEAFGTRTAHVVGISVGLAFHVHDIGEEGLHVA
jgi:hypothetical protein